MSFLLPNAKAQFIDNNGAPLVGGFVYFYIPNTSTPKNTYQDEALTILNTNPIVLDARGEATIWGSGAYRQVLQDSNGNLIWDGVITDPSGAVADLQESLETGALYYLTNIGGTGDAITASASFTFTALTEGMTFWFKCKTPNSAGTIPTIKINGGAAVSITGIGQMIAGTEYQIIFDGTNWQGQNPNQTPSSLILYVTSGTSPAFTLTPQPAIASYKPGLRYNVQFTADGTTGSNTLNISGLGAINLKQLAPNGTKYPAIIANGLISDVEYDGTDFVVLDSLPSSISGIQSLTASVSSNALTVTYNGGIIGFRNAVLATGAPITPFYVPPKTITIPLGATLGTINGQQGRLIFLLSYNAGSPVLCVGNSAGGLQFNETNLISPTTISSSSTSASIIYSASTVVANSPYRVIGICDVTETTAGTWATAPTLVQGAGGQALISGANGVSMVRLNTANGFGSTNTVIRRFSNVVTNQGPDITYADSATLGASFTINTAAVYSISYTDNSSNASSVIAGLSLNTATPNTVLSGCAVGEVLSAAGNQGTANSPCVAQWTGYLPVGSVIRPHTNGASGVGVSNAVQFTITKVS